ncbi:MAG TPA: sulfatase [Tepidisphaeraceae bacterium]|nr:sulfatase [Tepidisphaeraceae bacterium]
MKPALLIRVVVLTCLTTRAGAQTTPPHIVLFIADDFSWHDAEPYGATDVRTPNMAKLAKQGMRFDHAIAASPTCTPSRSAIYTGLFPFRNGAHPNHSLIKEGIRTLPDYFKELGYRVVLAGKTHVGPREQFAFEYLKGSNFMPSGKKHVLWTELDTGVVDRLLAEHEKGAQPLCLLVCTHSPHVFWPNNEGYDPAAIDIPPYLLDTPQTRRMRARYYTDVTLMDSQLGDVMASLDKHGYVDNTLLIFTADQGAQWPMAKWTLYDAGIRAPLIVRWPGRVTQDSSSGAVVSLIDLLPTMLEAAGGSAPNDLDAKSFLPVLRGNADHHRDATFAINTGDKTMNRSPMRAVRTAKYKYILNLKPQTPFKTHITDAGGEDGLLYWRSWEELAASGDPRAKGAIERYRHRPAEELYDVQADPYELKNRATDPAHAAALADLRQQLKQWRLQQGEDLNVVPMPEDARTGEVRYAE